MILLMPSRASTSLLLGYSWGYMDGIYTVSMPSRASTSLLRHKLEEVTVELIGVCQCPLGLVPPCYKGRLNEHFFNNRGVNALSG